MGTIGPWQETWWLHEEGARSLHGTGDDAAMCICCSVATHRNFVFAFQNGVFGPGYVWVSLFFQYWIKLESTKFYIDLALLDPLKVIPLPEDDSYRRRAVIPLTMG